VRKLPPAFAVLLTALMVLLPLLASAPAALAQSNGQGKTVICHRTEGTNEYVRIEVGNPAAAEGHRAHPGDIINPPGGQCPKPPTPTHDTGTLKICKVLEAGTTAPAGTLFTFSVGTTPARTAAVAPGTCTELEAVPVGSVLVTETGPAGFEVTDIRFLAGTGTVDVPGRRATATIVANLETEVQFTNRRQRGFIQICKETVEGLTSGTFSFTSPAFAGTQSITVVPGATQPVCTPLIEVNAGTVAVTEAPAAGTELATPGARTIPADRFISLVGRTATFTVVPGGPETQTLIVFRNRPVPPPGFIQICKETDGGLTGTFSFTSPAFAGTQSVTVVAGATQPVCTPLIQVLSGTIAVTEAAAPGTTLVGARAIPAARFVDLVGRTVRATVVPGGPETQTLIVFRNRAA